MSQSTPADSYVGVSEPTTPTKYIRNLSVTQLQSDGTTKTVQMQVVMITDTQGNVIDLDTKPVLDEILLNAKMQTKLLRMMAGSVLNTEITDSDLED